MSGMDRLRIFAALLGCLAALATGAPAFASIAVSAPHPAAVETSVPAHCDSCPECNRDQCPMMVDCTAPCGVAVPMLGVISASLPSGKVDEPVRPAPVAALHGQHPPPDPLPPRA
jgi:hypothetical protein